MEGRMDGRTNMLVLAAQADIWLLTLRCRFPIMMDSKVKWDAEPLESSSTPRKPCRKCTRLIPIKAELECCVSHPEPMLA